MIQCEFLVENKCLKAYEMGGEICSTTAKACQICLSQPTRANHVTASLALQGANFPLPKDKLYLLTLIRGAVISGPGTELKKLIYWLDKPNGKCHCDERILKMNEWGPDKCLCRIETITRWIRHEAAIRHLPFERISVRALIRIAIYKARNPPQTPCESCQ